jgi:hypothetical protein
MLHVMNKSPLQPFIAHCLFLPSAPKNAQKILRCVQHFYKLILAICSVTWRPEASNFFDIEGDNKYYGENARISVSLVLETREVYSGMCCILIAVDQIMSLFVQYAFWNVNTNSAAARNASTFHPPCLRIYDVKNTLSFITNFILLISIEN